MRSHDHLTSFARRRCSRQHGFTLIELLAALGVAIVLLTWALPGYRSFVARHQVSAEVMRLKTALALARNSAVARNAVVSVCPVPDPEATQCDFSDWSQRLVIVEGQASGGNLADTTLLRVMEGSGTASVTFSRQWPIRYQANGLASGHNGTFTVCGRNGQGSEIVVNNMGRARTGSLPRGC